jgi:hypothetical protein
MPIPALSAQVISAFTAILAVGILLPFFDNGVDGIDTRLHGRPV